MIDWVLHHMNIAWEHRNETRWGVRANVRSYSSSIFGKWRAYNTTTAMHVWSFVTLLRVRLILHGPLSMGPSVLFLLIPWITFLIIITSLLQHFC
jgi:hypothetical protein